MNTTEKAAHAIIEVEGGQRLVAIHDPRLTRPMRIRVLTEESIAKMSKGSLAGYSQKIYQMRQRVHEVGNADAIKAIDYLHHATRTAYTNLGGVPSEP